MEPVDAGAPRRLLRRDVRPAHLRPPGLPDERGRDHEHHLHHNGTRVIKIFLHISPEEQKRRLLRRLDNPEKNWKFNAGDLDERKIWNKYMHAYEECLHATSTDQSPWYIIPADDKPNARLLISRAIRDTLRRLKMNYPQPTPAQLRELKAIRASLS